MLTLWGDFDQSWNSVMDRFFEQFDPAFSRGVDPRSPARHALLDQGDKFVFVADLPGFLEKDLKITATGETLTVEGERKPLELQGYAAHRRERAGTANTLRISRSFALPARVQTEAVNAVLKDGVLQVTLPKAVEVKPRAIEVKVTG